MVKEEADMVQSSDDERESNEENAAGDPVEHAPKPNQRLIITHMTLENFKSYAGIQQIGPFHKRFSSVVGPNGSGKSNVIDAMLFVFGKRAKQLRLNKVSELIHKSEAHMNLDMCKVSVHFVEITEKDEDGEDFDVVEGSQLEVSRAAFSDNTNKYYLNGRGSNYKEVTTLLKRKGIDLDHNRFLILQGEVEQISLMPPKAKNEHETGMLEYLEDIIGSNRLVESIEESGKQVDVLNEERSQRVNKLKIVEKERENLSGAKEEAEEFLSQQRKLLTHKALLYQLRIREVGPKLEEHRSKKEKLETKLAADKASMSEANKQVEDIEKDYQAGKQDFDEMETELRKTKEEFTVFERQDIKFKEDLKHLKAKEKKLKDTVVKEKDKATKAREAIPKQQKAIAEAEATVHNMERLIPGEQATLDGMYEATREETAGLRGELAAAEQALSPWAEATNSAQAAVDMARSEMELVEGRARRAQEALAAAKQKLADAEPTRKATAQQIKTKQAQASKLQKQLAGAKEELKALGAKEGSLRGDVKAKTARLEEGRASAKASKAQSSVLKVLMEAKKSGKIKGIHGRLGDLGSIDAKYDVAISTACGALNHIVVENTQVAQRCCDVLRSSGAGVGTFLMLDKQQHLLSKCEQPPEGALPAARLVDLVKPTDEAYRPAFYFALRDTLVAPDLDQAMKMAYQGQKRHRVVTLDGAVIDTSGTMSGGGGKVQRGGMGTGAGDGEALSSKELAALESEVAARSEELTAARARMQELEGAVREWEKESAVLGQEVHRLELDLDALGKEEEETRANMAVFEKEATCQPQDKAKVKELQQALALNEKALAKAKAQSDKGEAEVSRLQEAIMHVGGEQLRMQKKKVEGMQRALEEATAAASKAKVGIKSSEKAVEKAEAAGAGAEEELDEVGLSIAKTREEYKGIEEQALKVMESYKATQLVLEDKKESLTELEKEYERVKAAVAKLRAAQVDLENELQDAAKAFSETELKIAHYKAKWDEVRDEWRADQEGEGEAAAAEGEGAAAEGAEGEGAMVTEEDEEGAEGGGQRTALTVYSDEELARHKLDSVKYQITTIEEVLGQMSPNLAAIAEWRSKDRDVRAREAELDKATAARDEMRAHHDALRKQRLDEFMAGFSVITMRLKEMYQMITLGGDAELELVDSLDPFSEGIVFSVRPPKKSWKNISNLSGGEKTLSSLSLVFALHHYKPTPLYVMDEIDAALDFKNVSIVANYIKERTKDAQFIIISLRNNMFELADRLVGIYKTHHCTKSVAINPAMLAAHLPAAVTAE